MSAPSPDARWRPVMALAILGMCMAALSSLCPPDGWQVGGVPIRLQLPAAWQTMWGPDSSDTLVVPRWKPEDVEDLLAAYDAQLTEGNPTMPDSTQATSVVQGSFTASRQRIHRACAALLPRSLHGSIHPTHPRCLSRKAQIDAWRLEDSHPRVQPGLMDRLWAQLQSGEDVHILHYGDSQIEGDRITGTLRGAGKRGGVDSVLAFNPCAPWCKALPSANPMKGGKRHT